MRMPSVEGDCKDLWPLVTKARMHGYTEERMMGVGRHLLTVGRVQIPADGVSHQTNSGL